MLAATLVLFANSGKLFLAGGGTTPPAIVEAFFMACGGKDARIVVLPLASEKPDGGSQVFLKEHGATNTVLFAKAEPTTEDLADLKIELERANGVWMPGGVQERYMTRLGKGFVATNVRPLLDKGVNFYGTSAGAMVCSATMITGPGKEPNTAETAAGFGLTSWVIDTHFKQRNREGRLRHALQMTDQKKGVGINEREWIVIWRDVIVEQHGAPTILLANNGGRLPTMANRRSGQRIASPSDRLPLSAMVSNR
jgi:cyanophycinase